MSRLVAALLAMTLLALAGAAHAEHLDPEENTLWTLLNDYRQENGIQSVGLNPHLMGAAEWMAEDMAANDYCSHTDSLGRGPKQRMADFGYIVRHIKTGENIVCGAETGQKVFDLMKGSPKHNAAMLRPYFWAVGIARAFDPDSAYGWYWTVDFGGRGPAWFPPGPVPTPMAVLPTGPYESPHGDETLAPAPIPTPTPAPVPAELPHTGTRP